MRVLCIVLLLAAGVHGWSALSTYTTKLLKRTFSAVAIASCLSITSPLPSLADRPLNAPTAAGTRVNSDPESLLRLGLPINCKEIRDIQGSIESIKANLKSRRIIFAQNDLNNAKTGLSANKDKILKQVPASRQAAAAAQYAALVADLDPLSASMAVEASTGSGSKQQADALADSIAKQNILAKDLTVLEEMLVPEGFKRAIPSEYKGLPALQGRAEVEMVFTRPSGEKFNVDGLNYDNVKVKMVIDGYNAPITGGNIVDLVKKGFYNKRPVTRADGFVIQTGDADPEGTVHGYVPSGASEERKIPLELSFKGDKELVYGSNSEDEGRGAAAAALPFQAFGALGMARDEFENDTASSQFFWLLFESDLTPAGKNMMDGRYSCFGYTTEGAELLKAVKEGDVISSAMVVKGGQFLEQ